MLLGLFGLGFGTLVKNQVAAILLTIGGTLILEGLLIVLARAIFHYNLNWLPNGAGAALAGTSPAASPVPAVTAVERVAPADVVEGRPGHAGLGPRPATIGYFTTFRRDVT